MSNSHPVAASSKVLLLIIDGLGDITIPQLGYRTPLEVAHTPNLDALAAAGLNGQLDPVEPGLACGSDTAHMSIFGYDPRKYYRGRGAFESLGTGLEMAPGDIAFKSNFATLNPKTGVVVKRRADRHFEELGPILCGALDGLRLPSFPQHQVSVKYATEHRCGVVVRGEGLTDAITGTDPLKDLLPLQQARPTDHSPEAEHTAAVVNELSREIHRVLQDHPVNARRAADGKNVANVVLLRGCGCRIKVPTFQEQHGLRPCLVAPTKIIAGLGMAFGIEAIEAPGATGFYNSDFASKATTVTKALIEQGYEFAFLHVKAVDDAGHDRNLLFKVKFLEVVDKMVGQIVRRLHEAEQRSQTSGGGGGGGDKDTCSGGYTLCVTGDHSTPVVFGDHSHEPVPFAVARVSRIVDAMGGEAELQKRDLGHIELPIDPGSSAATSASSTTPATASVRGSAQAEAAGAPQEVDRSDATAGSTATAEHEGATAGSAPDPYEQLRRQGELMDARRRAARDGVRWVADTSAFGPWRESWPQVVFGDEVGVFNEIAAARGALGRFPGSEVMGILRQFAGVP